MHVLLDGVGWWGTEVVMRGEEIRERRERAGLSRSKLARDMGVAEPTVYRWEHDRATPRGLYWERLEAHLRQIGGRRPRPPAGPDGAGGE